MFRVLSIEKFANVRKAFVETSVRMTHRLQNPGNAISNVVEHNGSRIPHKTVKCMEVGQQVIRTTTSGVHGKNDVEGLTSFLFNILSNHDCFCKVSLILVWSRYDL